MHGKHARKESVQACTSVTIDLGCLQSSRQSGNDSGPVLAPMHVPSAPNRRCWAQASLLALFVVSAQLVGAVSKVISEDYNIKSEKDGQPVYTTILSYVSLSVDCCSSILFMFGTVYILAIVAETPPTMDFLQNFACSFG